jgi:hypothetical protein
MCPFCVQQSEIMLYPCQLSNRHHCICSYPFSNKSRVATTAFVEFSNSKEQVSNVTAIAPLYCFSSTVVSSIHIICQSQLITTSTTITWLYNSMNPIQFGHSWWLCEVEVDQLIIIISVKMPIHVWHNYFLISTSS